MSADVVCLFETCCVTQMVCDRVSCDGALCERWPVKLACDKAV